MSTQNDNGPEEGGEKNGFWPAQREAIANVQSAAKLLTDLAKELEQAYRWDWSGEGFEAKLLEAATLLDETGELVAKINDPENWDD